MIFFKISFHAWELWRVNRSNNICSYLDYFWAQAQKNKKKHPKKYSYISRNGTFLPLKKLMKLFCTLNNTPLGETGCLRAIFTIYRLLKHLVFISFFVTYKTPCHAIGHYSLLILCGLRGTMPHQSSLLSSFTTFVIYRTPYHAIVHHPHFAPNPYLGR